MDTTLKGTFHFISSVSMAGSMFPLFSDAGPDSLLLKLLFNVPKLQNVMALLGDASGPRITYFVKGIGDTI